MKRSVRLGLFAIVATTLAPRGALAFSDTPIVVNDDGTDNSGTLTATGAPALSGTNLTNACQQLPLPTREDVFQWLSWLRGCGGLTQEQVESYAPGYGAIEQAWIDAKARQLRDPTITPEALQQAQAAALAAATGTWTYPIFVDPEAVKPRVVARKPIARPRPCIPLDLLTQELPAERDLDLQRPERFAAAGLELDPNVRPGLTPRPRFPIDDVRPRPLPTPIPRPCPVDPDPQPTFQIVEPTVSAEIGEASPIFTPHFFDWVRYYKVQRGRVQSLLQDEQVGCYADGGVAHVASGKRNVVLAGTCTSGALTSSLRIDNRFSQSNPRNLRCRAEDLLGSEADRVVADARNKWAYGCRHVPRRVYDQMYGNAEATIPNMQFYLSYARDATSSPACEPHNRNPAVSSSWTNCFPTWKPETDGNGAPTKRDGSGRYTACELPPAVMPFVNCAFGCYAPEQRVLFSDGYQAIREAFDRGRLDVVTLSPDATFDELRTTTNEVESYVADHHPEEQELVTLEMESGAKLRLTPDHPMLAEDGTLRAAKELLVGERLVRKDGTFEAIRKALRGRETVAVVNLSPRSLDDTSNLLFVEGYITASQRYQSPEVLRAQRQMLRRTVPVAHVR